jgi:hypothetical protein
MSMHRSLAAGLWLLAAAGACAVAASWADDAQTGKIHPWVLVVLFWGAAAVSVAIHHLSRFLAEQLAQAPEMLVRSRRCIAQAQDALRRAQLRLARERELLGSVDVHHVPGREALEAVRPHLTRAANALANALRRLRLHLGQGRDLLRGSWRQHADAGTVSPTHHVGHVVEIGS